MYHLEKLETLVPGFKLLSDIEQKKWLNELQKNTELSNWIKESENQYCFQPSNFALRSIHRTQVSNQLKIYQKIVQSLPQFPQLTQKILIARIIHLGLPFNSLSVEDQEILSQTYAQFDFCDDLLEVFLKDERPNIQSIKEKMKTFFENDFGFLFLTDDFKFYLITSKKLNSCGITDKNKILVELLNDDWGNHPGLFSGLKPLGEKLSSVVEPYFDQLKKYMDEISQAHIFYRFFGISSDHVILGTSLETPTIPFVNILDFYNYHTTRKPIYSAMNVWQTLFKPLRPFFNEYVDLAQSENNLLRICFRAFMPFLILSLVLASGYAAILPLAYHLLIEYVFFIPTLYFSIVIASQYIQIKNYLYLSFIQWYFGSIYAAPAFQANKVLHDVFKSEDLTQLVVQYYVSMMEQCDKVERFFHQLGGNLSSQQMINRKKNLEFKSDLINEWQDIRLGYLGSEAILKLVQARLSMDKIATLKTLKEFYQIYYTLNDNQKDSFKTEYLSFKKRYQEIIYLEQKLGSVDLTPSIDQVSQDSLNKILNII